MAPNMPLHPNLSLIRFENVPSAQAYLLHWLKQPDPVRNRGVNCNMTQRVFCNKYTDEFICGQAAHKVLAPRLDVPVDLNVVDGWLNNKKNSSTYSGDSEHTMGLAALDTEF